MSNCIVENETLEIINRTVTCVFQIQSQCSRLQSRKYEPSVLLQKKSVSELADMVDTFFPQVILEMAARLAFS